MTIGEIVARRDRLFGGGTPLFYETPVHLVRGEGPWLFGADGRRYLDMYNNIPVVGHCNPSVVAALSEQAAIHSTHSRYLDTRILDYAERLLALHADPITQVVFACTGTEANEIAMQMARMATGGRGFICTDAAYHGNSYLVGQLTHAPHRGRADVHAIPFPDPYRPIESGLSEQALGERYLGEVRVAIDDFAAQGTPLAGILLCSILANEGLPDIPAGFMRRAAAMVREAGGVVILDEVQAGFCRTGAWWGYESTGVVPDIVTMGKPMGNGLPLAACAARADLVGTFRERTGYFNTFSSTSVHAAVGMAVIDEIEGRGLARQATEVGEYLRTALRELAASCEPMGDVRGTGLFVGIDWVVDRDGREPDVAGAVAVANALKERGFLVSNAGAHSNLVKIRPPLVFERQHADLFLAAFADTIDALHG